MSADIDEVEAAVQAVLAEEVEEIEAEEIEAANEEVEAVEEEEVVEPEFTEKELEAKEMGWNPEGKDRDGNTLSAEEFMARKPLFNKIHNLQEQQERMQAQMQEQIDKLAEQNKKIAEAGIKKREALMEELREAKEAALNDLDVDKVRNIDKQIESVREEISQPVIETSTEQKTDVISPAYQAFLDENEWAKDESSAMYVMAEDIAKRYVDVKKGTVSEADVYKYVGEQIREAFPHKFEKKHPRQPRIGNNQTRQPLQQQSKKKTLNDIPEDQRSIALEIMEATGQTEDEYLSTYKF